MIEHASALRPDIRVLVVDDSIVVREMIKELLESDPGIRVVGMAANGSEAVELTAQLKPDLVTMDLVMPGMDGMEATERIMAYHPTPVLFFSSYFNQEGQYSRVDALAAGALDIVQKPTLTPDEGWQAMAASLVAKVKTLAQVPVITHIHGGRALDRPQTSGRPGSSRATVDVVGIGASSGGPRVLDELLCSLPADYGLAVVVVQHMAEGFMTGLITWLQQRCPLPMKIAEEGDVLGPGRVVFAPEWAHLEVRAGGHLHLMESDPVKGNRPSVDVTFTSLAMVYGSRAAGVILTGMGTDGAAGLLAIRQAGGLTLAQDEESCVVYGMPRAAVDRGAVQQLLSPSALALSLRALHPDRMRSVPR